jgi:hypothetical protein
MKERLFVGNSILYKHIIIYYTKQKKKSIYKRQADFERKLFVIIKRECYLVDGYMIVIELK